MSIVSHFRIGDGDRLPGCETPAAEAGETVRRHAAQPDLRLDMTGEGQIRPASPVSRTNCQPLPGPQGGDHPCAALVAGMLYDEASSRDGERNLPEMQSRTRPPMETSIAG